MKKSGMLKVDMGIRVATVSNAAYAKNLRLAEDLQKTLIYANATFLHTVFDATMRSYHRLVERIGYDPIP